MAKSNKNVYPVVSFSKAHSALAKRALPKSTNWVYLDYAAGVRVNPSSIHALGIKAKNELQNARKEVATILGARSDEIIFTSGGTESNNLAISGIIWSIFEMHTYSSASELLCSARQPAQGISKTTRQFLLPHIITTNIEHPSVLETCKMLKRRGLVELSIVSVELNGIVNPKKIKKELKENTVLVSVMYANNEIGTIQPIKEIAKEIRYFKKQSEKQKDFFRSSDLRVPLPARPFKNLSVFPLFHTDAVQVVNYLDLNVEKLGIDLLSLSGSKIEGAGRVGVLYKKKSVSLAPILGGGDQEMGLRPGTENLIEILKFSDAFKLVQKNKEPVSTSSSLSGKETKRLKKLQNYFFKKLENFDFLINGDKENRLPNNINITFPKIPSDLLVLELSAKGIMASSKSACKSSREEEGSYVIEAIRPKSNLEIGGLRFSLGNKTTKADIDYTVKVLSKILQKLKKWYN